jgi:uncharacterized damage-inducible protein DinB
MQPHSIFDDLYRYNSWANGRVIALCDGLSDLQLDEPRPIGFGTLRNTLFHILAAEEIWLERWTNTPWRPFPTDACGLSPGEIARRLEDVAARRQSLIDRERQGHWQTFCEYKDSRGDLYKRRLDGLLLHVANHGQHHRAQALHFLKRLGRTVPGGLDYLFFRFARPHVMQDEATVHWMRQAGLEVATGESPPVDWNAELVRRYVAYGDWANAMLLALAAPLDQAALDRSFGMGFDTIRKTLLHVFTSERWWMRNWTQGPSEYEKLPETTSVADLQALWAQHILERNHFIDSLDAAGAQRVVTVLVSRMNVRVAVIEALLQICLHGTHHRAQLINMLRHSHVAAPATDYAVWLREAGDTAEP